MVTTIHAGDCSTGCVECASNYHDSFKGWPYCPSCGEPVCAYCGKTPATYGTVKVNNGPQVPVCSLGCGEGI